MMDKSEKIITILKKPISRPDKRRVAAYARVSVDYVENLHSLSAQISYYNKLIGSRKDWMLAGIYSDEGLSGTSIGRPGFQELMNACESGEVDIILTKSISRFARNTVDLLNTVRHLKELNVDIWFERENIRTLDASGELLLTLLASFAQEESRSISENTKWSIRHRFEQGIGNNYVLYGYRWNGKEWTIEPEEARNVKNIFSEYLEGYSPHELARKYNLSYSSIWDMLRRINYTGTVIFQRTFTENHLTHKRMINNGELPRYLVEDYMPQLIDQDTFNKVQEEIARRKELGYQANQSKKFTCFSGNVYCEQCGRTYRRKTTSKTRASTGTTSKYHKWVCGTKISGGSDACDSCNIPDKFLWQATADILNQETLDEDSFREQIEKITVGEYVLHFHFHDGHIESREWMPERKNKIYTENRRKHGKEDNSNTGDIDKILITTA